MDYFLLFLGIFLALFGLIGCFIPVIPGPPLSFLSLLMFQLTRWGGFSTTFMIVMALLAVGAVVLDYIVPALGTKKFGGTKRGTWGATIGVFVGMFFAPVGIFICPLIGAYIGEYTGDNNSERSLKAAFGSFVGIMTGLVIKLIVSGVMLYYFAAALYGVIRSIEWFN